MEDIVVGVSNGRHTCQLEKQGYSARMLVKLIVMVVL